MLISLMNYLDKKSVASVVALGLVLLATVAAVDHVTGYELSFSVFYLLPIVLVAWQSQRWVGFAFCLLSASFWLFVDVMSNHTYSNDFIPAWNTMVRLSFFLVTTSLLVELKKRLIIEKKMAVTDGLTGLLNARAFKQESGTLLDLARRHDHPVALAYLDVDNFKGVNDLLGHSEGDLVLRVVADTLTCCVRNTDVIGRLGGDEFAIFLPETEHVGAQALFDRMHEKLTQVAAEKSWPIGFSVGIAEFPVAPDCIDEALKRADDLMYHVKKSGKNNLVYKEQKL